ncbi:MAG TPA: PAS domain S-box protein, partial [Gemmatimonadales bacterium]|nr:PAS domain S-box protein [Gemmatimonadales bacterium]
MTEIRTSRDEASAAQAELAELRQRLADAEETLRAIRSGEVDALVITTPEGEQIYTLQGAETAYRVMVEAMTEGAMTLGEDATILYCNQRLASMLGTTLEDLIGTSLRPYLVADDLEWFDTLLVRGGAGTSRGEVILQRTDGGRIPVQLSMSALDVQGARGLCCIATDLTEQKRNADIHASERLARSILEQAADAIVVCSPTGEVIRASVSASRLARTDCIGKDFSEAFPLLQDDQPNPLDPSRLGCTLQSVEAILPGPQGPRHLMVSAAPLFNADSESLGCVITMVDITGLKAAEAALKEADRRKDEFLAVLSHELRNPLAPVRNAVGILKLRGSDEPELRWAREIIERQVHQMTRLIDDLLDVSRITQDRLELRREQVALAQILREAVEMIRPMITQEGHELEVSVPKDPVLLHADGARLAQVFANLLNNAAKYTPAGGRITLCAWCEGPEVLVSVRDNGVGIA